MGHGGCSRSDHHLFPWETHLAIIFITKLLRGSVREGEVGNNTRNIFCWAWEELRKDKAACLFKLRWMPQSTTSRSSDPGSPRTKLSSWKIQAYHHLQLTCISLHQDGCTVPTASSLPAVTFLFLDSRMASTLNAETVSTYLPGFLCFLKQLEERLGLCHFTVTSQHSSDV